MASKTLTFETGHEEMIHDAQLDYYGKRLATCSSDRSIRIFDVHSNQTQTLTSQIRGHDGPVWQVAWAHPKFGSILASASYDGRVCVWKEQAANAWVKIYEYSRPDSASMNTIQFAPYTFGLCLAAGATDGTATILTRKPDNTWDVQNFLAHKGGVNSVNWGPDVKSGALLAQSAASGGAVKFDRKILTGGCDNHIRLWRLQEENNTWYEVRAFQAEGSNETAHSDWVRDAAFAPSLGLPSNTIASCSEDKSVIIWTEDSSTGIWRKAKVLKFDTKIYKVSWSLMGNILAIAQGDNKVSLWKESIDGDWKNLSQAQAQQLASGSVAGAAAGGYVPSGSTAPNSPHQQQHHLQQSHGGQPQDGYAQQQHATPSHMQHPSAASASHQFQSPQHNVPPHQFQSPMSQQTGGHQAMPPSPAQHYGAPTPQMGGARAF